MATYTHLPTATMDAILQLYGKGPLLDCLPLGHGISNSNHLIKTSQGEFILKVSNDKDFSEMNEEMLILKKLKEWGYGHSPLPEETLTGAMVYDFQNYHGALFLRFKGQCPIPSEIVCRELGKALGHLHALSTPRSKEGLRPFVKLGHPPSEIDYFITKDICPEDFRQMVKRLFPQGMDSDLAGPWEMALLHGDFYYDNSLFEGDRLIAVLDFEQAGVGPCLYDLGIALSGCCLDEFKKPRANLLDAFLQGYQEKRSIPREEQKKIHQSILFGLLSISLWRIKRFLIKKIDPSKKESYKDLLKIAADWHHQQRTKPWIPKL